jgi:undecaprenyl-diphosphatase
MVPVATPATAGQRTVYVRHPGDVIRVALGAVLVAACSVIAAVESVSGVEAGLFRAVNSLPSWLYGPLWLVMQLGSLGAVFAVAAAAALFRRFRLALELVAAGLIAYYSAKGLKNLVGRPRPAAVVNDVETQTSTAVSNTVPAGGAVARKRPANLAPQPFRVRAPAVMPVA